MSDIASMALAGMNASTAKFEASAKRVVERPDADLASELVTQREAVLAFKADLAVLRIANRMSKSLLDILV
jgi:flagellar basal body rod protein FlgC